MTLFKALIGVAGVLASVTACAQAAGTVDDMAAFPSLSLENVGVTLFYRPELSELLNEPHPDHVLADESGIYLARPLRTRLLGQSGPLFTIDCNSGGSWDPSCSVLREDDGRRELLLNIPGLRFAFPGDGNIYVDGHNNSMFNVRRHYRWRDGRFEEVAQPYRYVGLDTRTRAELKVYGARDFRQVVSVLPKGSSLTVLLNEQDDYLVKLPYGVLGWVRIPMSPNPEWVGDDYEGELSPIEGLYYAGD